MYNKPSVSVVMSTYNGEEYLCQQIDSILCQEGVDVKLYIRDDGSSDGTKKILLNYLSSHSNIYVDFGDNIGFAKSFLIALKNSPSTDYYAFSDQDDVWYPDKLISTIELIQPDDHYALAYQNCYDTDPYLANERLHYSLKRQLPYYGMALSISTCSGFLMVFDSDLRKLACMEIEVPVSHDIWVSAIASYVGVIRCGCQISSKHRRTEISLTNNTKLQIIRHRIHSAFSKNEKTVRCAEIILERFGDLIKDQNKKDMLYDLKNYRFDFKCKKRLAKNKSMKYPIKFGRFAVIVKILFGKF